MVTIIEVRASTPPSPVPEAHVELKRVERIRLEGKSENA